MGIMRKLIRNGLLALYEQFRDEAMKVVLQWWAG